MTRNVHFDEISGRWISAVKGHESRSRLRGVLPSFCGYQVHVEVLHGFTFGGLVSNLIRRKISRAETI